MAVPEDWTDGPAKRLSVFLLGAAIIIGLAHTLITSPRSWRGDQSLATPIRLADSPRPLAEEARSSPGDPEPQEKSAAVIINVNSAAKAELELLPGIGPALADRIIAERERGGPFKTLEDLGRVRGIGAKTIERLRPHANIE